MTSVEPRSISVRELADVLRSVDSRVALVPPRILRRVIRGVLEIDRFLGQVPHRGGFQARSAAILEHAEPEELNLAAGSPIPGRLILLAEPDLERVEDLPREEVLLHYWRALFHARVHVAYDVRDDDAWVEERIERLGRIEFAEARAVLVEDSYLTLPADDRSTFAEFAAVYLELLTFHPAILPHTFPAIRDHEAVLAMLAADVDPDTLRQATRPPGAPEPIEPPAEPLDAEDSAEDEPSETTHTTAQPRRERRLKRAAEKASVRGNNVRSAILRMQAASLARGGDRVRDRSAARAEIESLALRLRSVVSSETPHDTHWRSVLTAFLDGAARGHWSRQARLLYDLQRACLDRERLISAIDLVGWITSAGRRSIRRPMPDQREVMVLKHLRSAARRVRSLRGPEPARTELERLLAAAIERQERAIRERFRPRIGEILDRVSLRPHNAAERASGRKLVEELLDGIVERGFLRIGDLRDAISRNGLKLADLSGPGELLRGDPLLRADDALARDLDGVYHRGEVYLRTLQRASSLAFGTKVGRWLSLFVALPFGAAFVMLEGLQHIVGPIVHATTRAEIHLFNPVTHICLGLLLLGLVNFPWFRAGFSRTCGRFGRALKSVFYDAPAWLLNRRLVRSVVNSRSFLFAWNWVGKPIVLVGIVLLIATALVPEPRSQVKYFGLDPELWRALLLSTWFVITVVVNSRSGRVVEEIAADGASRLGQRLWRDLIPSAFRATLDFFNAALDTIERVLYGVDEWLRFRGGEGRVRLATKAVLGLAWAVIAYLARIYINLLIEPQVNPIKHFPVVTVSHKIMLPLVPQIHRILMAPLTPLGPVLANAISWTTVFLIPGVFGFMVWELKENWRLYAANRPSSLRPTAFGHHGETMSRLLRRGFHSGTIPKLFARLRAAERRAERGRGEGPAEKRLEQIHHAAEAVRHFVERGVVYVIDESRAAGSFRPRVGHIECATNRVVIELRDGGDRVARIAFEESNRQLRIRLVEPGWLLGLSGEARRAMASALAGLCAMSDADVMIEPASGAPVDARCLCPEWSSWVSSWEADASGQGHRMVVADADRLLPGPPIIA